MTDNVVVDGFSYAGTASKVWLRAEQSASSDVVLSGSPSSIASELSVVGRSGVRLDAGLTTLDAAIDADSDCDGIGSFVVSSGSSLATSNQPAFIKSSGWVVDGSVNTGSSLLELTGCAGQAMSIGGNGLVSSAELQRLTSTGLTVHAVGGDIDVHSISAADTSSIAGLVTLNASASGDIMFVGASVFKSLSAFADNGIDISSNITSTEGDLLLRSESSAG